MDNEKDINKEEKALQDVSTDGENLQDTESSKQQEPNVDLSESKSDGENNEEPEAVEDEFIDEDPPEYFSPLWHLKHNVKRRFPKGVAVCKKANKILNLDTLFVFILFAVVGIVGYYILFPSRGAFHSDTTDTILWAQATLESKSIFNDDFYYACILPFGGHLIMIPFVAIFGVTMKAHVLGMFTFFLIFVISMYGMLRKLGWDRKWTSLTVAFTILLVSGSVKLREIFWEHIIYYSLGLLFAFVGISLISSCIDKLKAGKEKRLGFIVYVCLLFVWCFLTGLNQIESLTIFLVPAFAAYVAERFFASDRSKDAYTYIGNIIIGAAILFGAVLGYIVCAKISKDVIASYESAYSGFSDMHEWITNFEAFYLHWITLFGIDLKRGMHILTMDGVIGLIKVIVCVMLVIAPVIMLFFYKKIKERKVRILLLFHWFMTALVMMGYILGLLASANWRLTPILCTSIILTFACAKTIWDTADVKRISLVFVLPLILVGCLTAKDLVKMPPDYNQDKGLHLVGRNLKYFEEQLGFSLDYGYATFWNANALTVITDSEIPVRGITLSQNSYYVYEYQTQKDWYEDQEDVDKYFVLLTTGEYNDAVASNNELVVMDHTLYAICEGYYVLVYDQNIF